MVRMCAIVGLACIITSCHIVSYNEAVLPYVYLFIGLTGMRLWIQII